MLTESQRLDPSGGTLLHLALCHRREGKSATAWAEFHQALSAARRDGRADREVAARDQIAELEPRLSRLIVILAASAADTEVKRDGTILGLPQMGTPVPVDPGEHTVTASAAGRKPWSTTVHLADSTTITVTVPELDPPEASLLPTRSGPEEAASPSVLPDSPLPTLMATSRARDRQITAAIVVGSVGVATLGLGSYLGLRAWSKRDASDAHGNCVGNSCPEAGYDLRRDAQTAGTEATAAFISASVLLGTSVALWVSAPRAGVPRNGVAISPMVTAGTSGMAVRGAW
jgi:hypothetical protein